MSRRAIVQALKALDREDARLRGPDGEGESPFGICTMGAEFLQSRLGGEVRGYFIENNPRATVGEAEGGHDFLVLPDYIVDWWGSRYIGGPELLHRVKDARTIARLYGDESRWEPSGSTRTEHLGATIPMGDCFRWAAQEAQRLEASGAYRTVYVVHAIVNPYTGTGYAKPYPHAWVEFGSGWADAQCQDWQRMMHNTPPVALDTYYATMHPQRPKRFTVEESLKLRARTKHWGPW